MTSDQLDEVPAARRQMLAELLADGRARTCDFPQLGQIDPVVVQRVERDDGSFLVNLFNTGDTRAERAVPQSDTRVSLEPHESHTVNIPRT
jgi:alpha-galactosidase